MFRPDAYLRNAFGLVLLIVCYNLFAREDIDGDHAATAGQIEHMGHKEA